MNNCVGIANTKFFLLFLVYTFSYCLFAISMCITYIIHRVKVVSEPVYLLVVVALIGLYGLFFSAFTISMFVDSIGKLKSGNTGKSDSLM